MDSSGDAMSLTAAVRALFGPTSLKGIQPRADWELPVCTGALRWTPGLVPYAQ